MTELIADPFVQTGVLAVVGAVITRCCCASTRRGACCSSSPSSSRSPSLLSTTASFPTKSLPDSTPAYERIFIAAAKIIWWINAAWLLAGFTHVFLIFERRPQEGRLLQDLVVGLVYLGAALSVLPMSSARRSGR